MNTNVKTFVLNPSASCFRPRQSGLGPGAPVVSTVSEEEDEEYGHPENNPPTLRADDTDDSIKRFQTFFIYLKR